MPILSPPLPRIRSAADFFIKWMSKINTFIYRRSDGEGFGSNFQGIPAWRC